MANVLVYAPFASWSPHYETDLELGRLAAEKGDRVSFLLCDGSLPSCAPNPTHTYRACQMCKARSKFGIKWLKNDYPIKVLPTFHLTTEELKVVKKLSNTEYTSIQEIKELTFEGCDIGMAALSSVISYLREPKPSVLKYQELYTSNIKTALIVYFTIKSILTNGDYDQLIIFNGRFSALRPALRVARQMGIEVIVHERGTYINEYSLTKNTYPHDINYIYHQLMDIKKNIPVDTYEAVGGQWFEERMSGQQQNWKSFIEEQQAGKTPKELQTSALKVAIFNSSEDEFQAIEEWKNPYYKSQNEGLIQILDDCKNLNIQVILRVHPNLKGIHNTQTQELNDIKNHYKSLIFIEADSDISTYDLIKQVDLIIAFGSTVGIEAAYMNKAACIMGKTPYDILDACIKPKDHQALINIIRNMTKDNKPPKCHNDSTIYGYWQKTRSKQMKHIVQTDIFRAYLRTEQGNLHLNDFLIYRLYITVKEVVLSAKQGLKCLITRC